MKQPLLCILGLFLGLTSFAQKWESMFNGKDLTGWTPKIRYAKAGENVGNTFRVQHGKIVVSYDAYDDFNERFGHLFYNTQYGYYRIRLQYRFIGEQVKNGPGWAYRNSGIMVHGQTAESMGKDQDFPVSIEVQLLGGDGKNPRTTCNLCTPGTHVVREGKLFTQHCLNSTSKTYHGDQWVHAEVLVLGDSLIVHYANGEEVLRYENPQIGGGNVDAQETKWGTNGQLISKGTISLQSESHPVEFRKIEILNLEGCMDPKATNYKSYYVKSKPEDCRYK
ncbi:MAG: 3-keto-disaccharide hydrolase [Chitinophagaceae bacterium]